MPLVGSGASDGPWKLPTEFGDISRGLNVFCTVTPRNANQNANLGLGETNAMATSSKFNLSSGSPDRPVYPSGQRGAYPAASLNRSGSLREGMENRILSALPSMSRSGSTVTHGDVMNFFQCLRFDPKLMAADHKFPRQGELKRVAAALGMSTNDSLYGSSKSKLLPTSSLEELKRVKASLHDSSVRARERAKNFNEALSLFGKYFPSIPLKKRSRAEVSASDRSNASLSNDRTVLGANIAKMGTHNHGISSDFELDSQKLEERTKNPVPNKRTRTSMVDVRLDVRAHALARPSVTTDREREMFRLTNSGAVQSGAVQSEEKDRTLSIGVDGWEKSKMRKKRSGIKPDVSTNTALTRPLDNDRESKQGIQQRLISDARSRLSDTHGFRVGPANTAVGVGRADAISHQTGLGVRSSMPRTDQDNGSLPNDRRDRPVSSDKERVNLKAANKPIVREEFSSASPTSSMKINVAARAPRSGSGAKPKSSSYVHRAIGVPDFWELSQCNNKPHDVVGANNRKRTSSTRSSSPPVAQWAGQRPQKISRSARRTNFIPLVSSHDEASALDTMSNIAGNENGLGFPRRLSSEAPQQVKLKGDHFSSAALSESEESGAGEIKSRDIVKKSSEIDEKAGQTVQKDLTLLPSRKNKLASDEDNGDGVRRQGRTGRGFTSTRPSMPVTIEKLGYVGTVKELRSGRLGLDKTESKAGRLPTRKLSDRKAYTRQRHTTNNGAPDFQVESGNAHEELLAAAKAAINLSRACSSSFWRQMEPLFGFVEAEDIAYLKQQGDIGFSLLKPTPVSVGKDDCSTVPNGNELIGCERNMGFSSERKSVDLFPEQLVPGIKVHNAIPLCQRLLAAFISEEEDEGFCSIGNEDLKLDRFDLDAELKPNILKQRSLGNFQIIGRAASNGYRITAARSYLDELELEQDELEHDDVMDPKTGLISNFGHSLNGLQPDQALMPRMACTEFQYDHMSLDERLLLEVQSIGIFPEPVPDLAQREDEEIGEDISRLEDKHHEQVLKKKFLLGKLEKSAMEVRKLQEREIERHAFDKLVGMAYEKYMTYWGPNASGGKVASSKLGRKDRKAIDRMMDLTPTSQEDLSAKHAALAFVKRTLERCQTFEDTGNSCFGELIFRDMFLSMSSHLNDAECIDTITEGESTNLYADTATRSLEVVTDSVGLTPSPISRSGQSIDTHEKYSSNAFHSVNQPTERTTGKEDTWLNKVKKRELLLDDVIGATVGTSLRAPTGIGSSLISSTKGKRSEREREGKGHNRDVLSGNGTAKVGRPALSNVKGERKSKPKLKQKTTQLSASVNGLLGKIPDQPKAVLSSVPKFCEMTNNSNTKGKYELGLDTLNDPEAIDLSGLQLPGMDVLGVPDDIGGQGEDLSSWLNIDDDGLQDHDFMGLEIPMDDLSDLNMMV
ncbi:hypothetical protein HHK36_025461 [Tetracentron sinense]|uniref:Uncharacterized protein n=1 Tax=Tetracentron sinense TaxID=13715 RepID=A0A834YKH6_TETSI|nr:hypothetical protein HHK36_025461 [Tetracentron sinense]